MADRPPADFDWVTARNNCSMAQMLQTLRLLAKRDVEKRNEQVPNSVGFSDANRAGSVVFSVYSQRVGLEAHQRVAADFEISEDVKTLTVRHGDQSFAVTVTLDDAGVCRCRVGDDVLDPWQVLKMALEPILFR